MSRFYKGEVVDYDSKKKKHKVLRRAYMCIFSVCLVRIGLSRLDVSLSISCDPWVFSTLTNPNLLHILIDLVWRWRTRNSQFGQGTVGAYWQTGQDICKEGEGIAEIIHLYLKRFLEWLVFMLFTSCEKPSILTPALVFTDTNCCYSHNTLRDKIVCLVPLIPVWFYVHTAFIIALY